MEEIRTSENHEYENIFHLFDTKNFPTLASSCAEIEITLKERNFVAVDMTSHKKIISLTTKSNTQVVNEKEISHRY